MSAEQSWEERNAQAEMHLKDAIAQDLTAGDGEDVMVADYVLVARTLDEDGNHDTHYSISDGMQLSDILGLLRYADIIFSTKLANKVTRIDRGE